MNDYIELIKEISFSSPSKILLLVIDGMGGLPDPATGKTELETAHTPNLNHLAGKGICGLTNPVAPGITPGSAPGHLALFGYDPVRCNIGRGVLEAVGIDFDLKPGDVSTRGNFCTIDEKGLVTDRRAGRISTEQCAELCQLLDGISVGNVKVLVSPVKEHRFVAVFRGEGLTDQVSESDPQQTGIAPREFKPLAKEAGKMADTVNAFAAQAKAKLVGRQPANMLLLRGFSTHPHLPSIEEIYKLNPAAIAVYPMYRGLAKLAGMEILPTGTTLEEEVATLKQHYAGHDFFFMHVKWTDSSGEDGDFNRKVNVFEQIDRIIPEILNLEPDVIVIAGDHSTPAMLKGHSWHPVPVLLYSKYCRPDKVTEFSESACI
ncbi:2,3-bisphosphoglycerate-independent phosphoglycerate mutase, partial [Chloroflexota bacterium]